MHLRLWKANSCVNYIYGSLISLVSFGYQSSSFCGIRLLTLLCPCCCNPVLSQHTLYGSQTYDSDAIGLSQGGAGEAGPTLRRQVQNLAAHDTVGYLFIINWLKSNASQKIISGRHCVLGRWILAI